MARRDDNLFSSGRRRKKRHDYRNASIGPNMGGFDAKGNTHTSRSVKKTQPAHSTSQVTPQRRSRTYKPGEIGYVDPATRSGESAASYARRRERNRRKMRMPSNIPFRGIALIVLALAAAIGVALGVASCVFQGSVNSRLALHDPAVAEALVAPESTDMPTYTLVSGSFHDPGQPDDGPDVLMLVRLEPQGSNATVISIPSNLMWTLTDGTDNFIGREATIGGDAGLIRVVSDFAGVDIAHFAKVDAEGFVALVDAMGGIELELTEEVDDPDAGDIYLPAGYQTLDGAQALTFCRAKNYLGSYETRSYNQMRVLLAMVQKASSATGLGATQSTIDTIAGHFQTDLPIHELSSLLERFSGVQESDVMMARVPGYTSYEAGEIRFSVAPNAWRTMMEKVQAGADPNEKSEAVLAVNPADYRLTVKNGSGVGGAANQVTEVLQAAGWRVEETGNTDQFAYGETLVVYKDEGQIAAAEAIADTLGVGRPVEAGIYYSFETDLEVIVGQDWKPQG